MSRPVRQGDIYLADLPAAGRRPVVVVSRDALNRGGYATVVAFTTARLPERRSLPTCVFFRAGEFGLTADTGRCQSSTTEHSSALP